ncbi:MAG: hypothetical protein KDD25_04180 [Bdellovibrionales bacterium]|nr:hypothetical protein [Bdellovibrionales bacterium]
MRFCFIAFVILSIQNASAEELYEAYTSARAAGMGNAYSALVRNDESLFYNPAGLAKSDTFSLTVFNANLGANGSDVVEVAKSFTSSGDDFTDAIRDMYGKKIWLGGKGKVGAVISGIGAAAWGDLTIGANAGNPAFPTINTNYVQDYGFVGGVGFNVIPEFMAFGFTAKRITRTGARVPIGLETLATLSDSDLRERISNTGTGYGMDAGVNLSLPVATHPTLSLVWKNIGTTRFSQDSGSERPPTIDNELVFGFGLNFETALIDVRPIFDYRHAFDWDEQYGKKIHMGVEIATPGFRFRGGLSQGYYTLGAGVDFAILRVDAATYGVELGEYPGQHEDRRYLLELSMEFGFDASGGGWGLFGDGKGAGGGNSGFGGPKSRR